REFGEPGPAAVTHAARPADGLTDDEVVALARRAANGDKFARLWAGDASGYGSDSEADLALCGLLAYRVGPEEGRVGRLFARSGLAGRGKWADREDYRVRTIRRAIRGLEWGASRAGMFTREDRMNQTSRSRQEDSGLEYTVKDTPRG